MKYLRLLLCLIGIVFISAACTNNSSGPGSTSTIPPQTHTQFHEYPLPQARSGVMRPATDHEGRIWFGEMGQNALAVFTPATQQFQQFTIPHGQYGIMGVTVASDDTIWFTEQYANFIGQYNARSKHFTEYTLPQITLPTQNKHARPFNLPLAPDELAFDAQGNIWFTEMNADALGKLDIKTGRFTHYPLSNPPTVQQRNPYGITVDAQGNIWFTEAGQNKIGRYAPTTGKFQFFTFPTPGTSFMEITSDQSGSIWSTTFNSTQLVQFDPHRQTFTAYVARTTKMGSGVSGIYGITSISPNSIWLTIPEGNTIAHFNSQTKTFSYYAIPSQASTPLGITEGQNHTFWFTESATNQLGVLQP
jgi:streptogramin lyase